MARSGSLTAVALAAAALATSAIAAAKTLHVSIKDVAFAPAEISAKVGDRITWQNADIVPHTATSEEAGFDVEIAPGQTGEAVLKRAGTFGYVCRYHPNMTGRITVTP